ncbi:hypothetical protein AG1IA_05665 [Rhizoctonia solani AG-1 IA]|uniref:Uncharacterized protein n=1 Tax=Thanatephorus cucumeris (strain AG1-IA) TaxID=983506 RepID=L8WU88_THACA|nr:hypothetical protein AG1IA_05665 [Rhizoctonia solani AG-1 IA]
MGVMAVAMGVNCDLWPHNLLYTTQLDNNLHVNYGYNINKPDYNFTFGPKGYVFPINASKQLESLSSATLDESRSSGTDLFLIFRER